MPSLHTAAQYAWRSNLLFLAATTIFLTAPIVETNADDTTFSERLNLLSVASDKSILREDDTAHFTDTSMIISANAHVEGNLNSVLISPWLRTMFTEDITQLSSIELSLAQGRWLDSSWGNVNNSELVPAGSFLKVCISNDGGAENSDLLLSWKKVVIQLGGRLNAALFPMTNMENVAVNIQEETDGSQLHCLSSWLPQQTVCTENLAAVLAMLPCRRKGMMSAVDHIDFCAANRKSLKLVANRPLLKTTREQPFSVHVDVTYVRQGHSALHLAIPSSFSSCSVASTSTVSLACESGFASINDSEAIKCGDELQVADWSPKLLNQGSNQLNFSSLVPYTVKSTNAGAIAKVTANRNLVMKGSNSWLLRRKITSEKAVKSALRCQILEPIPWFMRMYLHTTRARSTLTSASDMGTSVASPHLTNVNFGDCALGKQGHSIGLLNYSVILEPGHSVIIETEFEKVFVHWQLHPPDPHRGFPVPPGSVSCIPVHEAAELQQQQDIALSLNQLLLYSVTPDFSMPYNVMTLAGTALALAFGTFLNAAIRPLPKGPPPIVAKVRKLASKFGIIKMPK